MTVDNILNILAGEPKSLGEALWLIFPELGDIVGTMTDLNMDINFELASVGLQEAMDAQITDLQSIIIILLKSIEVSGVEKGSRNAEDVIRVLTVFVTVAQHDARLSGFLSQIESSKNTKNNILNLKICILNSNIFFFNFKTVGFAILDNNESLFGKLNKFG